MRNPALNPAPSLRPAPFPPGRCAPVFRTVVRLALCLLIAGCSPRGSDEEEAPAPPALVPVHVEPVRRGDIPVSVSLTGTADVLRKEKVFTPVAGRVLSFAVLEYQSVRAGDTLAVIGTRESQAAIDGARAMLAAASTPKERSEAETMLKLATQSQSKATVRAAFSGVVASRSVTRGELVAENAELLTLLDPETVCFVGDLPLADAGLVRTGQPCVVGFPAMPSARYSGVVDAISPQSDLESQTVKLRIRFTGLDSAGRASIRTGMTGSAAIVTDIHRRALLVPASALLRDDETDAYSVVVVTPDSLARTVAVSKGARTDSTVEISGPGIREGTPVVTGGNYALPESTRVTILPRE
jgi:RND family efflux transporter MFP subunit